MSSTCRSSGPKSASALVATGRNLLHGVIVAADGTNDATVTVYDNTSAAGTKLLEVVVDGAIRSQQFDFSRPVVAELGLYVAISGTGAGATVFYG